MIWRMAALLWLCSGAAMACPGMGFQKDELSFSARQLATPRVSTVRAGGTVLLGQCPDLPGVGNISFDPSASILYVPDRRKMDLEMRAEGECDPVLLVRAPSGRFFFDDDDGGDRNAHIRLAQPPAGRYSIWVGSRSGVACPARLTLQAVRGVTRYAARKGDLPG